MSLLNQKKSAEERRPTGQEPVLSIIAQGTKIDGAIISEGDLRIEGHVLGAVLCRSRLVVGPEGKIEGNVDAHNATIAGEIRGEVIVRDVLQIQEGGRIHGDIITLKLTVNAGGVFTGNCRMGDDAQQWLRQRPIGQLPPRPTRLDPETVHPEVEETDLGYVPEPGR